MKVLIIGGTGLISTPMASDFLARGDEVTHYNRGKAAATPDGVSQITGDRKDYAAFERQIQQGDSYDCIIDMICFHPDEARSLVRAVEGKTGHLIVCSTGDVYAKPAARYPITEEEPHAPPPWHYARHKAVIEALLTDNAERTGLPTTVIRPAYTYGEGRAMIHSFGESSTHLDRIRKGKPIVVHGDGSSLWGSCHRGDVARTFVHAAGAESTFDKSYHVTGEEWLTWNQYHEAIAEAIGAPKPTLVHIPTELLDRVAKRAHICAINFQYNNIFDNTAARADLEFKYTIPFRKGVARIYRWLEEHGTIANSDDDPYDDRVIAAWEQLGVGMGDALSGLDD